MTVGRILLGTFVALVVLLVLWSWQLMRPGPPIRLSKQTTYITEPLADDGLPDYVAYLDRKYSEGVTPENNATVLLLQVSGLPEVRGDDRARWFDRLGMENLPEEGEYLTALSDEPAFNDTANWLIAYWRSQQDGTNPTTTTMNGMSEYSDQVASGLEEDWMYPVEKNARLLNERVQQRPWTSEQIPPVAAWVDANADLLDMVVEASERPRMYAPMMTGDMSNTPQLYAVLLPTVQDQRMLCRRLQARTMRNLGEGRYAEAQGDIFATHRLARLRGDGPFLIHYLVAIALDGMACEQQIALASLSDVPAEVLEASLDELQQRRRWQQAADLAGETERLAALDAALSLRRNPGGLEYWGVQDGQVLSRLLRSNIDWNIVLERLNGYYDELVAAMRTPDRGEQAQAFTAINTRLGGFSDGLPSRLAGAALSRSSRSELIADVFAGLLIPAVQSVTVTEERANANLDLTTTALALGLYRARHGTYPDSLDALVPEILDAVPIDLFADAPLRYERRDEGYVLYSIGQNSVDDGGTNQTNDIVAGEWAPAPTTPDGHYVSTAGEDDLVVRVPMPALVIPPLPEDVTLPPLTEVPVETPEVAAEPQ